MAAAVVPLHEHPALMGRDLHDILRLWEETHSSAGFDPEPIVTRCVILCNFHNLRNFSYVCLYMCVLYVSV